MNLTDITLNTDIVNLRQYRDELSKIFLEEFKHSQDNERCYLYMIAANGINAEIERRQLERSLRYAGILAFVFLALFIISSAT